MSRNFFCVNFVQSKNGCSICQFERTTISKNSAQTSDEIAATKIDFDDNDHVPQTDDQFQKTGLRIPMGLMGTHFIRLEFVFNGFEVCSSRDPVVIYLHFLWKFKSSRECWRHICALLPIPCTLGV